MSHKTTGTCQNNDIRRNVCVIQRQICKGCLTLWIYIYIERQIPIHTYCTVRWILIIESTASTTWEIHPRWPCIGVFTRPACVTSLWDAGFLLPLTSQPSHTSTCCPGVWFFCDDLSTRDAHRYKHHHQMRSVDLGHVQKKGLKDARTLSWILHLNDSGHKGEPFGSRAATLNRTLSSADTVWQWHKETISTVLSVVLLKPPPLYKQGSRVLHVTAYPLIRTICPLMATPIQTPSSDWFTTIKKEESYYLGKRLFLTVTELVREEFIDWRSREGSAVISTCK